MKKLFPVVISIIALVSLLAFVVQEDLTESTKLPSPTPTIANTPGSKPLYKKGDPAFPLQSRFWIDDQGKSLPNDTSLASFKGRAVFMVFTGKWCSACENAKPIYQKIREEFDEKDVAFVAIHTPEISEKDFEEWVSRNPWFQFATIDRSQDDSNSIQGGESAKMYQVTGFPAVIVLDREGRISYSDELMRQEMNREQFELVANDIARKLGIELPLENLGNEERRSALIKISTRALSKHITDACNGDRDATSKTDNNSDVTSTDISAVYNQNLAGLAEVRAEWQIRRTPGPGAIRGIEYQTSIGKKNVDAGNRDPGFANMADSKAPETTEWWGQLVIKSGAGQLAFVNPLNAGTPTPAMPLPFPLSSDQFTADLHKGWSVFSWDNGVEGIRCMIGQRQSGLLSGATLKEFPQSAEFQFPPLLAPPREMGGIQHPYDSFFSGPFFLAGVVDLDGHSCQLVERLGDPLPVDETALPESLRGRYKAFPRLRAWLDRANAYLPIRIESDKLVLVDEKEVQMHKGSIAERILTAKLSRIDIEGCSVVYPTKISVETRRIDPLFQGPYEDDILGVLNGSEPLPDYPYVIDWSVDWDIKVAPAKVGDRDLALEFPDQIFYMDQTRAAAVRAGDGARESLAQFPKTVVNAAPSRSWIMWISMSLFAVVVLLLAKRKLARKRVQ